MRPQVLLTMLVFLSGAACQTTITCDSGYTISAAARSGCRSAIEPGCVECCSIISDGRCARHSRIQDSAIPSYSYVTIGQTCLAGCPPCALCSAKAEKDLCELLATPRDCDCTHFQIGNDPCTEPMSCDCYCLGYMGLLRACPSQ